MNNRLHGLLFAFRASPQLRELVQHRNVSSLPYAGRYRMIDFMLSNMVNAGVSDVGLVVHANYQSLLDHVGSGKDWDLSRKWGGLRILPPFGYSGRRRAGDYRGRMDALGGVFSYLKNIRQEYVVMADGDIAANLDIDDVFEQHLRTGADITAVCTKRYSSDTAEATYFALDENDRIQDVMVGPATPFGYECLEVFIISKELLIKMVEHCMVHNIYDFSVGVLQPGVENLKLMAYRFEGYSAVTQSVNSYFADSMALLNCDVRHALFNSERPIKTKVRSDCSTYYGPESKSSNSLIADGCIIEGEVVNSILFRGVRVGKGARVENSILMSDCVIHDGANLNYTIADKGVEVSEGRMLMGHETYPLAIAKNTVV